MTVDLANLTTKTTLTGTEQIILNDGGLPKDVTVDTLMAGVVKAAVNPVTGRSIFSAGGYGVSDLHSASELPMMLRNATRPVRVHVYGNSLDADNYFWRTVAAVSGGAIQIVKNSGTGGYNSAQVHTKMVAEGFDATADVVAFGEGTNDCLASVSDASSMANLAAMIRLIRAARKVPLLRLPPPNENAWNTRVLTNWMEQLVLAEQMGVYAWDAYAKYCDTDGTYVAGFSTDNTHPTSANYSIAASEGWTMLTALARPYWLPRSNAGQGLFGANVLQLTDTNTDGLADGWSALGLTGHTINAASNYSYPFRGKKNSIAISQSANGSVYKEISTGYSVGERLRMTGVFGCSGMSNCNAVVYVRAFGPNTDFYSVYTASTLSDQYVSADFVVPVGTTSLQLWVRTLPTTAGAYTGTIEFGAMDIYNITRNTLVS